MMYHGYGMGAAWPLIIFAVVLPTLLLVVGLLAGQFLRAPGAAAPQAPAPDAERVLADRLARGEINPEEYEQRLHTLRAGGR